MLPTKSTLLKVAAPLLVLVLLVALAPTPMLWLLWNYQAYGGSPTAPIEIGVATEQSPSQIQHSNTTTVTTTTSTSMTNATANTTSTTTSQETHTRGITSIVPYPQLPSLQGVRGPVYAVAGIVTLLSSVALASTIISVIASNPALVSTLLANPAVLAIAVMPYTLLMIA